ncbi:hypothetical protein N0V95_000017 [Ascochyta clinopodiicola]|nr:hypothetical protein N0V95_000017 [Ascochyta clinopodiicola]
MKLPQVVLADFGMGFFERDAPPTVEGEEPPPSENPFEYVWHHNHKSHAIEHQTLTGNPPYPLGEKTDVWKLGALIWELMTCSRDNNEPMREDVLNHEHEDEYGQPMIEKISVTSVDHQADLTPEAMFPEPWRLYPSAHGYSGDLKAVVRNCLHWKPQSRTSLTQLDSDIDDFVAGNPMAMHNATTLLKKENDPFGIGRRLMRFRKY